MTASAGDRLARLLNLVPYLLARPGIRISEAAADLGVSEDQLRDDLELLWVCGVPGYGPGDLIDMSFDGDRVTVTYDAGINRPLRLTPDEATALVVALRTLQETPGVADREAIERALHKIEDAAAVDAPPVAVRLPGDDDRLSTLRGMVSRGKALRISYYSAARDVTSERVIDPMRLLSVSGRSYLEAWCRQAQGVRMFRVDRIDSLVELDESASPPPGAVGADLTEGVFQPDPRSPLVTLRVGRGSRWITEYYPCETVVEVPGSERLARSGGVATNDSERLARSDGVATNDSERPSRSGVATNDGEWLVSLRVNDMDWARRFVLGLGPDVVVVEPEELAEAVRVSAQNALDNYS